jgi:hypothetical protein
VLPLKGVEASIAALDEDAMKVSERVVSANKTNQVAKRMTGLGQPDETAMRARPGSLRNGRSACGVAELRHRWRAPSSLSASSHARLNDVPWGNVARLKSTPSVPAPEKSAAGRWAELWGIDGYPQKSPFGDLRKARKLLGFLHFRRSLFPCHRSLLAYILWLYNALGYINQEG